MAGITPITVTCWISIRVSLSSSFVHVKCFSLGTSLCVCVFSPRCRSPWCQRRWSSSWRVCWEFSWGPSWRLATGPRPLGRPWDFSTRTSPYVRCCCQTCQHGHCVSVSVSVCLHQCVNCFGTRQKWTWVIKVFFFFFLNWAAAPVVIIISLTLLTLIATVMMFNATQRGRRGVNDEISAVISLWWLRPNEG